MAGHDDQRVHDTISLRGVSARGRHGVLPSERQNGQRFIVDADLSVDLRSAGRSDALTDTVNYADVAQRIVDEIRGEPVDLIERLAQRIADALLRIDRVDAVTITVHKPQAPIPVPFTDVAVRVHRTREANS